MAEEGQVISFHSAREFEDHTNRGKETKKLVVVDFTAKGCGPCLFMAPVFTELSEKYTDVIFLKVDVDKVEDVADTWNVRAMPTFLFLKDGVEVERVMGARKEELEAAITKHSAEVISA